MVPADHVDPHDHPDDDLEPRVPEGEERRDELEDELTIESLEARILMSATWVDADTGDELDGPTDDADIFHGGGSHDDVDGLGGDDQLFGESGNDKLFGGDGDDLVDGGSGNDQLWGDAGDDVLVGDSGNDKLTGGDGDDDLDGDSGNDLLYGGAGDDVLVGDSGNDVLKGDEGADSLTGGTGNDVLKGGSGDDVLVGDSGNDVLKGEDGDDLLRGGSGNDTLKGGDGHDTVDYSDETNDLTFDLSEDKVHGESGHDNLSSIEGAIAGSGDDTFEFDDADDGDLYTVDGGDGFDTIDLGDDVDTDDVTVEDGAITVDLGDGESYRIEHENIEEILVDGESLDLTPAVELSLPDFTVADAAGLEDAAIPLDIEVDATDVDYQVRLVGLPEGAVLSAGTPQEDGSVLVDAAAVAGLTVTPPADSHADFDLEVSVVAGTEAAVVFAEDFSDDDVEDDWTAISLGCGGMDWEVEDGQLQEDDGKGTGFFAAPAVDADLSGGYAITVDVDANTGSTYNDGVGIVFGYTDDDDYYVARWTDYATNYSSESTHKDLQLLHVTSAGTELLDVVDQAELPEEFELQVEVTDDGIRVLVDGVEQLSDDSTPALATFGLYTDDNDGGVSYDDLTVTALASVTESESQTLQVIVTAVDDAPVQVFAGSDQGVDEGDVVTLSGSGSDPEGQELTYSWVQTGGTPVTLSDPSSASATFTAPEGLTNSDLVFELQVSDGTSSVVDAVTITVAADDDAPSADAGEDRGAAEGDTVTLTGSATDPEGQGLTYTWVQTAGPTVTLDDANATAPSFTAPDADADYELAFELQVSDGANTSVDTVLIAVTAEAAPAVETLEVDEGEAVILDGDFLDIDVSSDFTQTQKFVPADGESGDYFGRSVDIDGDTAIVGAYGDDDGANFGGAATVLTLEDGVWVQEAKLVPDDLDSSDYAGFDVAISGDTALVTAFGDDGVASNAGAVYVFERGDDGWEQVQKLTAPDGESYDNFGRDAAIDGDTLVIGAYADDDGASGTGSAYVFQKGDDGWSMTQKLTASDGASGDSFGIGVAIDGDQILVGAYGVDGEETGQSYTGAGYVFELQEGTWSQTDKLTIEGSGTYTMAGFSVALDEGTAVLGAIYDDAGHATMSGSAYVFQQSDGDWDQVAKLQPEDADSYDLTGYSVDVSGGTVLVGSMYDDDDGTNTGSASVWRAGADGWEMVDEVHASDAADHDNFGSAVAIDGGTILVGAHADDDMGSSSGSVYLFEGAASDLEYSWIQTSGPAVELDDTSAATPGFTAPESLANTTLVFEVTATDGVDTWTGTIEVLVHADDDAPTAAAGLDQTVDEGTAVQLAGSGTDPEQQGLTFTWVQTAGPAVTLDDAGSATPTFTAPEGLADEDLVFELQVSDGVNTSVDTVTITVQADDDGPIDVSAGADQSVDELDSVVLTGSGSDPEGQGLTYQWVQTSGTPVVLDDASAAAPSFTAPEGLVNSDLIFELAVSDGTTTVTDTVTIHVAADDDAPSASAGEDQTVSEHDTVTLTGSGIDPEGQGLTYQWVQVSGPSVTLDDANATAPTFEAPEGLADSDLVFELRVSDGVNTSADTVTINVQADDDGPIDVSAGADQSVDELDTVVLTGSGNDPEGQDLTYQWVQTSGTPVVLDDASAASPSFEAPEGLVNSDLVFELSVSDGSTTVTDTVTIHVAADDDAPSASAGEDQTASEHDTVTLTGTGVDPEGQGLTYEWVQLSGPAVTLDDANATAPTFEAPEGLADSDLVFELRVSDGVNVSSDTVTVTVEADDDAPIDVSAGPDQTVDERTVVTLTGSGTDPEGHLTDTDLTFQWIQTAGTPVTLDDASSAAPSFEAPSTLDSEELVFELRVSDGVSTTTDEVSITVTSTTNLPTFEAVDVTGSEDQPIPLGLELGETEQPIEVHVAGVPEGASLTAGEDLGNGVWLVAQADVTGLSILPAQDADDDFDLTLTVATSDGSETAEPVTVRVTVEAVADAADLHASDGTGAEDTWVALCLDAQLTDTDGSETLSAVHLTGVPEGAALSAGTNLGDGVWSIPSADLADLAVRPPANFAGELALTLEVTTREVENGHEATAFTSFTVDVAAVNDQAVADAGEDLAASEGDVVQLTGAGSDVESDELSYAWVQVSGTPVVLSDPGSPSPTFTAPEGLVNSELVFELRVSDGETIGTDTVTVTVAADDDAPTAEAGADQTVSEHDAVQLAGSGSDPEGQDLTYAWTQVSGPTVFLDDPSAAAPSFDAPEGLTNSQVVLQLAVSDGVSTSLDTVTVTIEADDDAPTADAGADLFAEEGEAVALSGSGHDPEGHLLDTGLTYQWVQTAGTPVVLQDATSPTPSFTAPEGLTNSELVFELQVDDGTSVSADSVTVHVAADNDAPTADAGPAVTVQEGASVQLAGSGFDPEGQDLTFTWVQTAGPTLTLDDPSSPTPSFTAPEALTNSQATFLLLVSDGVHTSTDTVTVELGADDDAPTASAGPAQVVTEGDPVQLAGSGTDPEGQALTFTWVQTAGTPVTLDDATAASPTFSAPEGLVDGELTFELHVSDGLSTSIDTVTISVLADDDAPVEVSAGVDQSVEELERVTLTGSGSDPEGQPLTYHWVQTSGTPVVLDDPSAASPTFDAPEGLVNSDLVFELSVSDGTSTVTDTVTVHVAADDDAPSANAGDDQTVAEHDTVTLTGTGVDPEGQGLTYQWVQLGGPAVELDDASSLAPTFTAPEGLQDTNLVFELQVSDGTHTSVDTLVVTVAADDDAPIAVSAGDDQSVDELDTVTLTGSGTDPEGQPLTYQWVQTSGTPVVLDDPSAAAPTFDAPEGLVNSDLVFELAVSDGTSTVTDTVTVHVAADDDAPSADAGADVDAVEGQGVGLYGAGTDPEEQGLTYQWVQISGTPVVLTGADTQGPTFVAPEGLANSDLAFELSVSDGVHTSTDTVRVHLAADDDAPTSDAGPDQAVLENEPVQLTGVGHDPEGQGLTFQWVQLGGPTVELSDASAAAPTFTAPEGLANTNLAFELRVSDGTSTSVDTVCVTVEADDDAPSADAGPPLAATEGELVQLAGGGADPEGQNLSFHWVQTGGPPVELTDASSPTPAFTAPEGLGDETLSFELRVSDGTSTSVDTVTVLVAADDDAPIDVSAGADQHVEEHQRVVLEGSGLDPEAHLVAVDDSAATTDLTFSWTQVSGTPVVLDDPSAASPTFDAPEGLVNSDLVFELAVSDGVNTVTDRVTVHVAADDDAPSADAGPDLTVDEAGPVFLAGTGSDPEGLGLTYEWVQLGGPTVALDDATSPNPTFDAPDLLANTDLVFELRVSDGTSTSTDTLVVTLQADDDAPTAEAGSPQAVAEGELVHLAGVGIDPEDQPLAYTWTQLAGPPVVLTDPHAPSPAFVAPEGLANTELVFALTVDDGTTQSTDTVAIQVARDDDAPTADAGPTLAVDENQTVVLSGDGLDPEGAELTYTWVQLSGPPVQLVDADTATPTFTAPEGLVNTDLVFELLVSDGTHTSADTCTVQVACDDDAPTADAGPDRLVQPGELLTIVGSGIDPEGQGLTATWIQVGGPEVTIDDPHAKELSFTVPDDAAYSMVTFQLVVSDGVNESADTVQVTVAGSPPAEEGSLALPEDDAPEYEVTHRTVDLDYHNQRQDHLAGALDDTGADYAAEDLASYGGRNFTHEVLVDELAEAALGAELEASADLDFDEVFAPIEAGGEADGFGAERGAATPVDATAPADADGAGNTGEAGEPEPAAPLPAVPGQAHPVEAVAPAEPDAVTAQEAHAPVEPPTDAPPADDLTALPEPTLSAQLLGFLGLSGLLRRKADEDDPQDPR